MTVSYDIDTWETRPEIDQPPHLDFCDRFWRDVSLTLGRELTSSATSSHPETPKIKFIGCSRVSRIVILASSCDEQPKNDEYLLNDLIFLKTNMHQTSIFSVSTSPWDRNDYGPLPIHSHNRRCRAVNWSCVSHWMRYNTKRNSL